MNQHAYSFLNNYFDKIYVLTLERAKDRHKKVSDYLSGLNFDFFYGVDKVNLNYEQLKSEKIYDDKLSKKLNHSKESLPLGHVGCSLSHRKIYEDMLAHNYKKILIFEDDVIPLTKNLNKIEKIFRELPSNWELIYLGYMLHEIVTTKMVFKQKFYLLLSYLRLIAATPMEVRNRLPQVLSQHIRTAGEHFCTHAYALTQSGAKTLI